MMFGNMRYNGLGFLMAFSAPVCEAGIRESSVSESSVSESSGTKIAETAEFDSAGIASIYIKTSVVHTKILPCKGKNIRVRLSGTTGANAVRFGTAAVNGTLRISCDPEWSFIPVHSDLRLEVEVPELLIPEFRISTVSSLTEFRFPGAKKIAISAVSGAVHLSSIQVRDSIFIKNISGEICMESVSVHHLGVSSHNGKIILNSAYADEADIVNSEGAVHVSGMKVTNVLIRNISGNISAVSEILPNKADISNTSGTIDLAVPGKSCFLLNALSVSGQVLTADIPVNGLVTEHSVSGVAGDSTHRDLSSVLLKTVSGAITVRKIF